MIDYSKYLFLSHDYNDVNCVSLLTAFFRQEFAINISLPEYPRSKRWMLKFTTADIDNWAKDNAKKIVLTEADNYCILVFKSKTGNQLIHFGLYIKPNKILHVEEGKASRIDILSDYWIEHLYGVYKLNELVH